MMTKQPTALTFDGDRIASGFHNVFTNSAGPSQQRVLVIITMLDTNKTTMSTDKLTQVVHI